jgi:LysR family hydrogen peroxide-inducible transcriptional activator
LIGFTYDKGAPMNIKDLRYLVAVAELGHFGQAAEQCYVSQPTLSGQIKKLEQELGIILFERTNRRVLLTDIGGQIAKSARRILREVDDIHDLAASSLDPLSGKFRLGAFPTLAPYVFPSIVEKVRKSLPDLRLILIEEKTATLVDKLRHGDIDAALLALPVHDDFLVTHSLFNDEFYLAVPTNHELTRHDTIDQSTLRNHRLLLLEEGHCLRDQALEICQLNGISEEYDFRATGLETLRQMVRAGSGITFIPEIAKRNDESGIQYIPFTSPVPARTIGLVWRKTTTRHAVIDRLIEAF